MLRYDTIIAIKGENQAVYSGFLIDGFKSRVSFLNDPDIYKTVYMIKNKNVDEQGWTKKFYGKNKTIKVLSTRLVLTEKINLRLDMFRQRY